MADTIEYGALMHRAMRGLIQEVLTDIQERGSLPGAHHFFITFDTMHPDVEIADWLSDRYPGEMTVVMQHWYAGLEVTDEGFSVTLNFGDSPEPLYIPFDAIKTFVDPSVEFGLRFESQDDDVEQMPEPRPVSKIPAEVSSEPDAEEEEAEEKTGDVVSLDSFRKH
ncbi:MAG: ClpXP protease specificity-enhancing factor SspB [Pseudomonadota bacterium]